MENLQLLDGTLEHRMHNVEQGLHTLDKKVTVMAITIPRIPKKFPRLDVSGEDNPLKAKINNTPEIK